MCLMKPPEILTLILFVLKILRIPRPINFTPLYSSVQIIMSYFSLFCQGVLVDMVSMYACLEKEVDYIPVFI